MGAVRGRRSRTVHRSNCSETAGSRSRVFAFRAAQGSRVGRGSCVVVCDTVSAHGTLDRVPPLSSTGYGHWVRDMRTTTRDDHREPKDTSVTSAEHQLAVLPCPDCGTVGSVRLDTRMRFRALPIGTWSLAGQQLKTSAVEERVPVLVCTVCGFEKSPTVIPRQQYGDDPQSG